MNNKSITLSEAKQKRVEKKFLICTLNSQIRNWCTQVSEKPLQAVFSSTELVPRLYLLPAVSPLALHRSQSSSLPPSSTSAQNPDFFSPVSPASTTIPFQLDSQQPASPILPNSDLLFLLLQLSRQLLLFFPYQHPDQVPNTTSQASQLRLYVASSVAAQFNFLQN